MTSTMYFRLSVLTIALAAAGLNSSMAQQITDVGIVSGTGGAGGADNPKNYESVKTSPVRASVEVARPIAEISQDYVDNFVAPTSTFASITNGIMPGAYGYGTNGSGGGDEKISFRGFKDGNFSMTFDGIPFQDSNDPTHHSQIFFPSSFIGGVTADRSPGTASSIGPANYGGTIGLLSRPLSDEFHSTAGMTYGSFATTLYEAEFQSGYTKEAPNTKFMIGAHDFNSQGAQTFNPQQRTGVDFKLESALTADTKLTAFAGYTHYTSNGGGGPSPSTYAVYNNTATGISSSYNKGSPMYLSSDDPKRADYYDYSHYDVTAFFSYVGFNSNLGDGWKLDNKTYYNNYVNKQSYANYSAPDQTFAALVATGKGGVDKLNSYWTLGNILRLTKDTEYGVLRTGMQLEYSDTPRHQNYINPYTGAAASGGIKFNEEFTTTIFQPYAEFAFKATKDLTITPGIKYNVYSQNLTQYADSGTVGNLGGAASVQHTGTYNDVLPFLDARYMLQRNWSVYGQFATGDVIPPSSVFDVTGANVSTLPQPIKTKTYQIGTVYQGKDFSVDADVFQTNATTSYSSGIDSSGAAYYYQGSAITYRGAEAAGNIVLGGGFNLYANAQVYRATYDDTGLSPANVPSDIEAVGLYYVNDGWAVGTTLKRVGPQWQDNTKSTQVNQWYQLDPVYLTNFYVNYTIKGLPGLSSAKVRFGIDNLFNVNYLTAFVPGSATSAAPGQNTADTVAYTAGRAYYLSLSGTF